MNMGEVQALVQASPVPPCWGFPGGSDGRASACSAEDLGLIPGSGRCPGEGNGNPLQYSCLEYPMDGGAWWQQSTEPQRVRHDWATPLALVVVVVQLLSHVRQPVALSVWFSDPAVPLFPHLSDGDNVQPLPQGCCESCQVSLLHLLYPGGPVAKTLHCQTRGPRFHPWPGNEIPHITTNDPPCCKLDSVCHH